MRKVIDLTGQRFGRLTVTRYFGKTNRGISRWLCLCDCGNESIFSSHNLKSCHTKSCGCAPRKDSWTIEEDEILNQFYCNMGSGHVSKLLNRTKKAINTRAEKLNLKVNFVNGSGLPKRLVIKKLGTNKVLSKCKIHGEIIHYYNKNKIQQCWECRSIQNAKYRKNPILHFSRKLRTLIRYHFKNISNKNGGLIKHRCFKNLDYTPVQLCQYLTNIQKLQNNKCPICQTDYGKCIVSIDHIIPLERAKTEQEVIDLFCLQNLNLMCKNCNSSKNDTNYNIWRDNKKCH